jgi:hypothetical protein
MAKELIARASISTRAARDQVWRALLKDYLGSSV